MFNPAPVFDQLIKWLCYPINLFLATTHLDDEAVCEMSKDRGLFDDYHDRSDSTTKEVWWMFEHKCKRCGKKFHI